MVAHAGCRGPERNVVVAILLAQSARLHGKETDLIFARPGGADENTRSPTRTVHFVYPRDDRAEAPGCIGREVGKRLEAKYSVKYYDYGGYTRARPAPGDVLLGHPHPCPPTCFRSSARSNVWARVLILQPFNYDLQQVAFLDPVVRRADRFLAITGQYWADGLADSVFSFWAPKMVHVDMAVDRKDYPFIKAEFHDPGKRRFLFIGHSGWQKNPDYLRQIAAALPEYDFGWIGRHVTPLEGFEHHEVPDFREPEARRLIADYDFLLTVGRFDANPTTILEAMAWGLIPVCTPQSGYSREPGVVNVPLDNPDAAARILESLQEAPDERLRSLQELNYDALASHYNYDRFAEQVIWAIESTGNPALREGVALRVRLKRQALLSPYACWRPANLRAALGRARGDLGRRLRQSGAR